MEGEAGGKEENGAERRKICVRGELLASPYLLPAAVATGSQMLRSAAAVSERSLYQQHTGSPHQTQAREKDRTGLHYIFKTPITYNSC